MTNISLNNSKVTLKKKKKEKKAQDIFLFFSDIIILMLQLWENFKMTVLHLFYSSLETITSNNKKFDKLIQITNFKIKCNNKIILIKL